jgi:hypothetical protein
MMSALVVSGGDLAVPFVNKKLGNNGEIFDEEMRVDIKNLLDALFREINDNFTETIG